MATILASGVNVATGTNTVTVARGTYEAFSLGSSKEVAGLRLGENRAVQGTSPNPVRIAQVKMKEIAKALRKVFIQEYWVVLQDTFHRLW